ncbi:PGF-pre-PGF domain-containing protein [Methanosarcina sp. KYL-1]|uniref:PGF-pre-PGF domain-containing protein n=1 Tax=Methanosarcina sp. KYL-1 TaxID=2602068 RepID=UPI002100CD71|nr:PGF-pre-PGF domain-containing protein [Methanosarcina sp. KYL-1]MCQ1536672.1 PGF-pre-PGF domain-containing protein [Methanosarcina sp. KYL-1]
MKINAGIIFLLMCIVSLTVIAPNVTVADAISVEKLTAVTSNTADEWDPVWSPDGNEILFRRNGEIYRMFSNGSGEMQLTDTGGGAGYHSWSPDGSKILYSFLIDDLNCNIWVMNADGSAETRLTGFEDSPLQFGRHEYGTWSPTGSKIAYVASLDDIEAYVITMNADGSDKQVIAGPVEMCYINYPAWSPDASKIAFATDPLVTERYIGIVNSDGSGLITIPNGFLTSCTQSWQSQVWSPDGSKILYSSDESGNEDIYIINADGTGKTRLTTDAGDEHDPRFSPDGSRILFVSGWGGNSDIWVMDADGSNKVQLTTDTAYDSDPMWSPDGTKIAFSSDRNGNFDIWVMELSEDSVEPPAPEIVSVSFEPQTGVYAGETATISVTVKNNGGKSGEGYVIVSFPNDEEIMSLGGSSDNVKTYPAGSEIWGRDGIIDSSEYTLVELYEPEWETGQEETLTIEVKPNEGSDEIVFLVRAALKNDATGDYERAPESSDDLDQQGWYADKYSIDVYLEEVKFRGKILEDRPVISLYSFDVQIDEILDDSKGNLKVGDVIPVTGHRDGPAQVDAVTVGEEVEVFGEYRGDKVYLSDFDDLSSEHYLIKIEPDEPPSPEITSVTIAPPEGVPEDGTASIKVTVKNNGGKSSEGYITVSFPYDEEILSVTGTGNGHNELYPKGSSIYGKDGPIDPSDHPLGELQEFDWDTGQEETLTIEVKPNEGSDEIVFLVRAELKNDATGDDERDPISSDEIDQQGCYAYKYSSNVYQRSNLIIENVYVQGSEIIYEIKNVGKVTASSSYTYLYINDMSNHVASDRVDDLESGEDATLIFDYSYTYSGGTDEIKVCADGNGEINEESDSDNWKNITYSGEESKNIIETLGADESFTTFVSSLEAANLAETLSGEGPFTVFAPVDDAFAALPEGTLDALMSDTEKLTEILLYHIADVKIMAADAGSLASISTLQGGDITVSVAGDGRVFIGDAEIILKDIEASNGVIHAIDTVMVPPEEPGEDEGATVLYDDEVALKSGNFTFVPVNNVSASYKVDYFTDLGALYSSGLEFEATDEWHDSTGEFYLESIGGIKNNLETGAWFIFINDGLAPSGLGLNGVQDGDNVSFYFAPYEEHTPILENAIYVVNLEVASESDNSSSVPSSSGSGGGSGGGGSSSGGGGGGAGSPEPSRNIEIKELSQEFITNGNHAKFKFPRNATCITHVEFDPKRTFSKVTTMVEMLKGKSAIVPDLPAGEVYRNVNIWVGNEGMATPKNIENAVVGFKVEKAWIEAGIDEGSITLYRYSDKAWNELTTRKLGEDENYVYFEAETPGFSPFVIVAGGVETVEEESKPSASFEDSDRDKLESAENESFEVEMTGSESTEGGIKSKILMSIVLFSVLILVGYITLKKRD